ncbi:hypothetical protein SKAU_G00196260 [Synaphobranchus kaupii]|uniref:Uncharacterized protein n=1 Tax=Synaphobranchus kaupii TaxID=118154 RepID=A0A9Q1FEK4_SYNKA|nr:hypothetical protein SKAU_G00196260 [Synaphobranchus kaupii]
MADGEEGVKRNGHSHVKMVSDSPVDPFTVRWCQVSNPVAERPAIKCRDWSCFSTTVEDSSHIRVQCCLWVSQC